MAHGCCPANGPRCTPSDGQPSPSVRLQALEGVAHFLCWAFHLANTTRACSRHCTQGIFMEEVHASNSLSSFKLAAPAQKDLGAVNNSVWLRDFHFAGPCSPIPQGSALRVAPRPHTACPAPSRCAAGGPALPSPVLLLPCFTFSCFLPASFFLHPPVLCLAAFPLLPRPSLPSSILSAFLSLPPLFIGSALQQRRQSHCAPCSLSLAGRQSSTAFACSGMAAAGC